MSEPVKPSDPDWNAWATLANDVTVAMHACHEWQPFSVRSAVAKALWEAGYRPTADQIAACIKRHREAPASRPADDGRGEGA